nr:unnamed protein product [Callosobruchus analis]
MMITRVLDSVFYFTKSYSWSTFVYCVVPSSSMAGSSTLDHNAEICECEAKSDVDSRIQILHPHSSEYTYPFLLDAPAPKRRVLCPRPPTPPILTIITTTIISRNTRRGTPINSNPWSTA